MSRCLGASLALYTVSHHLVALVKVQIEHLRMQYCQSQGLGSIEDTRSISAAAVSVTVSACSYDSNFGFIAA